MKEEIDSRLAVSRLAVMAFVRITCARAGSAAKDWCATGIRIRIEIEPDFRLGRQRCRWDRSGAVLQWCNKNVLSVSDFTWDKEGMWLEGPGGSEDDWEQALRGEVDLNRVKHHYGEICDYAISVAPDTDMVGRRASSWLAAYMFARGLFKVRVRHLNYGRHAYCQIWQAWVLPYMAA